MNTLTVKFQNPEVSPTKDAGMPTTYPISNYKATPGYAPGALFDELIARNGLKTDAALARMLMIPPPVISKVRHGRLPLTNNHLVRIHDVMQISIVELRKMLGVQS